MGNIGRIGPGGAGAAPSEPAGERLDDMLGVFRGTATMDLGARGEAVRTVQGFLATLGYDLAGEDGVFGRRTQSAVATFQRQAGLSPSGEVDGATYAALESKAAAARRPAPATPVPGGGGAAR